MSWRENAIRWLGGIPAEDAATLVGQRDDAEAKVSDAERRVENLRADYQMRLGYLAEADRRLTTDAVSEAEARVAGELADLRRIAAEKGDRYACSYSTCRVAWNAHELVTAHVYRFFLTPIGCSGAGFARALTPAETNVREAPPPPLAIRAVSIRVSLASPENRSGSCYGAEEAGLLAAARSAVKRHCVLRLDMEQWSEDIGPLDGFDLEGGRVRPYSPPEHVEAAMRARPRGWHVVLATGQFRLPQHVTLDIRVGLHGDPLLPPVPAQVPFDPLGSGPPPGYFGSAEGERLRRIVREEVSSALDNHPFHPHP